MLESLKFQKAKILRREWYYGLKIEDHSWDFVDKYVEAFRLNNFIGIRTYYSRYLNQNILMFESKKMLSKLEVRNT